MYMYIARSLSLSLSARANAMQPKVRMTTSLIVYSKDAQGSRLKGFQPAFIPTTRLRELSPRIRTIQEVTGPKAAYLSALDFLYTICKTGPKSCSATGQGEIDPRA